MILKLDLERLQTPEEVREFMAGNTLVDFQLTSRSDAYDGVRRLLVRLHYLNLSRPDKGLVRHFAAKITGLSRAQITRLIRQYRQTGKIKDRRCGPGVNRSGGVTPLPTSACSRSWTRPLGWPCSARARRFMQRQYEVFEDRRFERLAGLSHGHLYRLRKSDTYLRRCNPITKTQPVAVAIGERRKPHPGGQPGFLRVDSVHQGDLNGAKGLYQIDR